MSETVYSTIRDDDIGKSISVSVPFDLPLTIGEDLILAQTVHDDIQQRLREWLDGEITRQLLGIPT